MGDYNKLIVSCSIKKEAKEALIEKLEEFNLYDSAYHSSEQITSIVDDDKEVNVILVGQRKWGDGIREFCEWLKPYVTQGSGQNEVFAMEFSEYATKPTLYTLNEEPEEK